MKERGKIQRKYDSVFIYMYIYKRGKRKKRKKRMEKSFRSSEIRFYLKFRFHDNWTNRGYEKPVTISIRKEGIFQPRLLAIGLFQSLRSISEEDTRNFCIANYLSNFLSSFFFFSFLFSRFCEVNSKKKAKASNRFSKRDRMRSDNFRGRCWYKKGRGGR